MSKFGTKQVCSCYGCQAGNHSSPGQYQANRGRCVESIDTPLSCYKLVNWTKYEKKVSKKKKTNSKTTQTSTGPISFLQHLFSFVDHTFTKWNSCTPSLSSLLSLVSCPLHTTLLYSPFPINHLPPLGICCFHRNSSQKSIPVA